MRWAMGFVFLAFGQNTLRIGGVFSPQGGLSQMDTVFRLQKAPLYLWVEVRLRQRPDWDTLWVVLRTIDKVQGVFAIPRTKADRSLYRGRIAVRRPGIYLAMVVPPRQSRLVLTRRRFYITDAQHPTVAALRSQAQRVAASREAAAETLLLESESAEMLDLPTEALLAPESPSPALEESLELEEDVDSLLDMPLEEPLDFDDEDLDDFGLDDL